jgi:hypothetical protein
MPLCPQITNTPITVVNSTNFAVTSVFPVIPATNNEVNAAIVLAEEALAEADLAFAAAANSLQVSTNTIVNASNQMTAMNTNGITVYSGGSATTGARVVMNSSGIAGFNTSGTSTFAINASNGNVSMTGALFTGGTIFGGTLNINGNAIIDASGFLTATGATITGTINSSIITGGTVQTSAGSNAVILNGSANAVQFKNAGAVTANLLPLSFGGLLMHYGATPDSSGGTFPQIFIGNGIISLTANTGTGNTGVSIIANTWVSLSGNVYARDTFYNEDPSTVTNAANVRMDLNGRTRRSTASSARYKENIVDLVNVDELHPRKLLDIPVRAFSYKQAHLSDTDDRSETLIPGFIAEEIDNIYPLAADYDNGQPESWNDRILVPGMLALIQDLYKEIALLKGE